MNKFHILPMLSLGLLMACNAAQTQTTDSIATPNDTNTVASAEAIPLFVQCLMEAYPEHIIGYADNLVYWSDSTTMIYDDGKEKTIVEMMDNADIEDMSHWVYPDEVTAFNDAGRIRCEAFFKKMYGETQQQMSHNLTTITWCPSLVGQRLNISKVNNINRQLQQVSAALDSHPEWKAFLSGPSTVNWRVVAGTNRLSPHSYGITIDMGVKQSNYWKWDNPKASETDSIGYRNRFPSEIADIFEQYGFIWGGRWYHYDNMHFEYRPEVILYKQRIKKHRS